MYVIPSMTSEDKSLMSAFRAVIFEDKIQLYKEHQRSQGYHSHEGVIDVGGIPFKNHVSGGATTIPLTYNYCRSWGSNSGRSSETRIR